MPNTVLDSADLNTLKQLENVPFDTENLKYIPHEIIVQTYRSYLIENPGSIDWNRLAYVFYATNLDQLLPVFVNVRQLRQLKTSAKIQVLCSFDFDKELKNKNDNNWRKNILKLLKDRYRVDLKSVSEIRSKFESDASNWSDSFTKLYAFNQIQFDRVIFLDADAIIRRRMDQLFFLPPALLAAPLNYIKHPEIKRPEIIRSVNELKLMTDLPPTPLEYSLSVQDLYKALIENEENFDSEFFWSLYSKLPSMEISLDLYPEMELGSYVMVITPNEQVFKWLVSAVEAKFVEEYDMEIINQVWKLTDIINHNYYHREIPTEEANNGKNNWLKSTTIPSLLIIPHFPYAMLSGEFRHTILEHSAYLAAPTDFGYLGEGLPMLSIQRSFKNGVNYKNIEDLVESFPEVPYWDWAWRFDYEGKPLSVKEIESDVDIDRLFDGEKIKENQNDALEVKGKSTGTDTKLVKRSKLKSDDEDEISSGMGIERFGWNCENILFDSVYIHWSDWPLGKPWDFQVEELEEGEENWLFSQLAEESLNKCLTDAKNMLSNLNSNGDSNSKVAQLLEKELQFAERTCNESITSWKMIYKEYWKLLDVSKKEILSV